MKIGEKIRKMKSWLDAFPCKDEEIDETEEEKAKKAKEKETADAKAIAKGFKDAEEEKDFEEFKKKKSEDKKSKDDGEEAVAGELEEIAEKLEDIAEEQREEGGEAVGDAKVKMMGIMNGKDKKACDDDGDLEARLSRLEALIQQLIDSEEAEEETEDKKKAKDAAAEAEKAQEEEKAEEEEKATNDCAANWQDIAHRADILFPGIELKKPTRDHAVSLRQIKTIALKGAMVREETRDAVKPFVKGRIDKLTTDALDAAFIGASEVISAFNNKKVHSGRVVATKDTRTTSTMVADINTKNKEFYRGQK